MRTCLLSLVITVSSEGILDNTLPSNTSQIDLYRTESQEIKDNQRAHPQGHSAYSFSKGQITKSLKYSLKNDFLFASSQLHSWSPNLR